MAPNKTGVGNFAIYSQ